jgi:hypothetical protein
MDIENAKYNQQFYNNLSQIDKDKWIDKVYQFYNNSLPIIQYNKEKIIEHFNKLKQKQNYKVIKTKFNYKKYKLFNLIKFINDTDKVFYNTKNCFIDIIDVDYKINYIDICSLSDYYQNFERMKCVTKKYQSPLDYYKHNYKYILDKYFSNMLKYYEEGLKINKLDFKNCDYCVNQIYLQNVMYENNKFCTVYKPYLFKLLIEIFKSNTKPNILDLSSGWGDRLIAIASIQDDINLYIGIDPNKKLFTGYNKIVDDLIKDKNKINLINDRSENVKFNDFPELDIIFWSPPFFDQEIYVSEKSREDFKDQSIEQFKNYDEWESKFIIDIIYKSSKKLKKYGIFILYIGNINYDSFIKKMNYIKRLKFIGNLKISSTKNKYKNYMIFVRV